MFTSPEFKDITISEQDLVLLGFVPSASQASLRKDSGTLETDVFLYAQAWVNLGGKPGSWKVKIYAETPPFLGEWVHVETRVISTRDQLYELNDEVFGEDNPDGKQRVTTKQRKTISSKILRLKRA